MSQQGLGIVDLGELIDLANVLAADATEESVLGTNGEVTGATVVLAGAGYTNGETVTLTGGNSDATATVTDNGGGGLVISLTITAPGTGYTSGETVTLTGTSSDATAIVNISTQVKDMSFIIGVVNYTSLSIEIELKTDDNTNPAHCRVRHDGLGTDDLDLTTSATDYVILDGVIDTTGFGNGRHTIEFYLDDGNTETATMRETWVYGDE